MQYLADLATQRNHQSIHPSSQSQEFERKMNDNHRNQPLQSATIKATRYVPIDKSHSVQCKYLSPSITQQNTEKETIKKP